MKLTIRPINESEIPTVPPGHDGWYELGVSSAGAQRQASELRLDLAEYPFDRIQVR